MHSILPYLFALINLTLFTQAQQFSPLPGCKSTLCIFPSDAAEFLVGSLFDTRIEFHVLNSTYSDISILNSMQITIKIENRIIDFSEYYDTIPLLESWTFTYAKDAEHATLIAKKKEKPIPVAVVSLVWRNLVQKHVGEIEIFVRLPFKNIEKTLFWNTRPKKKRLAKNVILMISDGTSTAMISAARLIAKQSKMRSGKFLENKLFIDTFHTTMGHIIVNGMDSLITDSANSASAYSTGHKTSTGALGVYADSSPSHYDDPKHEHLMEILRRERPGCSLGIVTTADVVDATPAAFYAHTKNRSDKPVLVDQILFGTDGWNGLPVKPDVLMGGGGKFFHNGVKSESLNQTDYYKVFESFGYTIAHDASSLSNLTDSNAPLLGIFALGTMNVWMDRVLLKDNLIGKQQHPSGNGNDALEQPSLPEMTLAALEVLNKRSEDGFFLMVEAASVDKMNHQLDTNRALADLLEMDHTLGAVTKWLKTNHLDKDTLVMFTCDHGHGFEVYGTVDTEYFNKQNYEQENNIDMRDAIGTYDHGGWPNYKDTDGDGWIDDWNPRFSLAISMGGTPTYYQNYQQHKNLQTVKTQPQLSEERGQLVYIEDEKNDAYKAGIKKLGNIGSSEPFGVHSMQDVPVFAVGPGSEKIGRVFDNNELFFVIADAFGLGSTMKYNDKKTNGMRNSKKTKKIKDDYPDYKIERHMHGKYDRMDEL